jgi:hypothetical protein
MQKKWVFTDHTGDSYDQVKSWSQFIETTDYETSDRVGNFKVYFGFDAKSFVVDGNVLVCSYEVGNFNDEERNALGLYNELENRSRKTLGFNS